MDIKEEKAISTVKSGSSTKPGPASLKRNRRKIAAFILSILAITSVILLFLYLRNCHIIKLISRLKSPDPKIVESAEKELVKIGKPAVKPLIFSLKYDSDKLRLNTSRAIGGLGAKRLTEGAVISYKNKTDSLRSGIIRVLGKIGDVNAVDPLVKILESDIDDEIKMGAVSALGEIGDKRACPPIVKLAVSTSFNSRKFYLPRSKDRVFRESLKKFGVPATAALIDAIRTESKKMGKNLGYLLMETCDERSIDLLTEALNDKQPQVRMAGLNSLVLIYQYKKNNDKYVDILIRMLKDPDDEVKECAAQGLRGIKDERKIAPLISMLGNESISYVANLTLTEPEDDRVISPLLKCLDSDNSLLKLRAFNILSSSLKDRNRLEDIAIKLLSDKGIKDHGDRSRLFHFLEETKSDKSVDALINLIKTGGSEDYFNAFSSLKIIGGERVFNALIGLLDNKKTKVKMYAMYALGNFRDKRAVDPLINVLKKDSIPADKGKNKPAEDKIMIINNGDPEDEIDGKNGIKKAAIYALGKIGDKRGIDEIITYAGSDSPGVRAAVINALAAVDDIRFPEMLRKAVSDTNEEVRYIVLDHLDIVLKQKDAPSLLAKLLNEKKSGLKHKLIEKLMWRKEKWIPAVLIDHLKKDDSPGKADIIGLLGYVGDRSVIGILKKYMNDKDVSFRSAAAESLGIIGGDEEAEFLINSYKTQSRVVRLSIISALGKLEDKRAVPLLIEALNDKMLRAFAARALEIIGDERAVMPIAKCMFEVDDPRDYVKILQRLGNEKAVEPLLEMMKKTEGYPIRSVIGNAISSIGSKKAVEPLIEFLNSDDYSLKWCAAQVLGNLGDKRAVEPLLYRLENDCGEELISTYLCSLGYLKDKRALPRLLEFSQSGNQNERTEAIHALGKVGGEQAFRELMKLSGDREDNIRKYALEALGEMKDKRALDNIIKGTEDGNRDVRWTAANAMCEFRDEKVVKRLIKLLDDKDESIRSTAIYFLGKIGDKRAAKHLLQFLKDKDINVRIRSAASLYLLGEEEGRKSLIRGIEESNYPYDSYYMSTFFEVAGDRDIPIIAKYLDHRYASTRISAVQTLGRIGTPKALNHIKKALNDKNSRVRKATKKELEKMKQCSDTNKPF